jgi:hypothetical protein
MVMAATVWLGFADLKQRGIVSNWVTLRNRIKNQGFPQGKLFGVNTRRWPVPGLGALQAAVRWNAARHQGMGGP